ncbi:hypothetical protein GO755_06350 [Spirosoma sp. HMF4905]|uniref:Uncharacterized protein n=1 Tax=Spirosoma arboris TaxID=2682092 RepID=A0A7K1S782_9BACT|nr:hypothetical protein [Spirosoma arboris]MVM29645.1 hypothetical protein [Spirosoma arboris]
MKRHYHFGLLFWAVWLVSTVATAQDSTKTAGSLKSKEITADSRKSTLLFDRDSVLEFTLTANLRVLMKDRGEKPVTHAALLSYNDGNGPDTIPLTLKARGNFRRSKVNCSFPPLLVDLPKKKVKNTLFAHQNKLKLVTHCQLEECVVREYLVYKLYNLLTDLSFRAQLVRVTYADSLGKRAPETHWGCLLEDESDLAKRNGVKANTMKQTNMGYADSLSMATVAVFEYMIGNTDWSVPYLHNIRLFANGISSSLPVPYDFDHAGIVEASYAKPAEHLGIVSVRERVYRGPVYPMDVFQQVFDKFNQVKPQLYALYQNDIRLDKSYVKRTVKYLDEFYALINKPTLAHSMFKQNAKSGIAIKSSRGVSYNK